MANYQILKANIDEKIYENAQQKITGENLNSVLNAMVATLGAEYQFAGVATIDTNPETSDAKVFYIANGKGTYTNFGGINVIEDDVVILYYDTSWHKVATGIASQEKLTELADKIGILESIPMYTIPKSILRSSNNDIHINDNFSTYIFDVLGYGGTTIKISAWGLGDPNSDWAILACEKTDGTVVYIQNTVGNDVYDYEYQLPENAYKLAISTGNKISKHIRITTQDGIIISSQFELSKLFYSPKSSIIQYRDNADYINGLFDTNGTLNVVSTYRTYKFDIEQYVGKKLFIMFSGTPDSFANNWAAFVIEDINGSRTVHKDYFIGSVTIGTSVPGISYACCSYIVSENDKYLLISSYDGYISVTTDFETNVNPVLFPVGYEPVKIRQYFGTRKELIISQDAITKKIQSLNLLDINDPDTLIDKYIKSSGTIAPYVGYRESGFIPYQSNQILKWTSGDMTTWPYAAVVFYDSNKNYIGGIGDPSQLGYVKYDNPNCAFIRISYPTNMMNTLVISYDENVTEYVPYYDVKSLAKKQEQQESNISDLYDRIGSIVGDGSQWNGKIWYAYGTSITSIEQGKYANPLAELSGMILTNKGIPGGGIGDLGGYSHGQVRTAIMNTTDGKLNADLITLEVGANDTGADVPLGTIYDTDETTLCGCLNMCIRYLQQNTNAQIVIFPSPATITIPNAADKYYEAQMLFKQVCFINKCWWIDGLTNLGTAKITRTDIRYVVDNIHQTELGGYVFAKAIWSQLKSIPTFDTTL